MNEEERKQCNELISRLTTESDPTIRDSAYWAYVGLFNCYHRLGVLLSAVRERAGVAKEEA